MPDSGADAGILTVTDIGYRVWQCRREMGLTQVQAAARCGVGVRFMSDLENGKSTIEMGRVLKVLSKLGLKLRVQQAT